MIYNKNTKAEADTSIELDEFTRRAVNFKFSLWFKNYLVVKVCVDALVVSELRSLKPWQILWFRVESPVFRDTENWKNSQNLGRKRNSQNFTENMFSDAENFEQYRKKQHENKGKSNKTKQSKLRLHRKSGPNLLQLSCFHSL